MGNTISASTFDLFPFSMPAMAKAQNGSHGGYEYSLIRVLLHSLNGKEKIVEPEDGNWGFESPKGSGLYNGNCLKKCFCLCTA